MAPPLKALVMVKVTKASSWVVPALVMVAVEVKSEVVVKLGIYWLVTEPSRTTSPATLA